MIAGLNTFISLRALSHQRQQIAGAKQSLEAPLIQYELDLALDWKFVCHQRLA